MSDEIVQHTDRVGSIRYKLVLGKYPIVKVDKTPFGFEFVIQLPNVRIILLAPPSADVREGDLITLYTEILANAASVQPPQQ